VNLSLQWLKPNLLRDEIGYSRKDFYHELQKFFKGDPEAENHWGLGLTAKGVLRIVNAIDSPWMQVVLDTGNFLENRYEQMTARAFFVQAKTYYGGGQGYELDIDYPRIAKMIRSHNYHGWISLEFEGMEDYRTAIPKSLKLLHDAFSYQA
jgi:L-ribulose-5-phosphate 3-epimerase